MYSIKALRFIRFARNCSGSAHTAAPLELHASRTAEIIDGKTIAREIESEIRVAIDETSSRVGRRPHLTAVLVGDNEGSSVYVKNKIQAAKRTGMSTYGKHVLVCGRSTIVGLPLSIMLGSSRDYGNATVSTCHSRSRPSDLRALAQMADIVITATGVPGLITADMIKNGACVIDVGITRVLDEASGKTRLVGDVDFIGVSRKASYITPVPGGVGPVTVAMLMRNTFLAYSRAINYQLT
ncbi:NAD-dependent methylenetetrahydrofolate dehydrogenase isoform X2 [Rhipicephalus microplus]|uniref:NAD-dependent methylenetetrahydrofolate dehydrogenase isoform X2 n=1 Tax=Rhipicephalus microplus TaxID=6941 RepID=UPI003F6AA2F9